MIRLGINQLLAFEKCPQYWHRRYVLKGKGTEQSLAFYRFSSAIHFAAKKYVEMDGELGPVFDEYWGRYENGFPLVYRKHESWESLRALGHVLLRKLGSLIDSLDITPVLVEQKLSMQDDIFRLDMQPDLIGERESGYLVLDYKTTEQALEHYWVHGSDQLSGGALLLANELGMLEQVDVAIVNLVKSGDVHLLESRRTAQALERFRAKLTHYAELMEIGVAFKRPLYAFNSPCRWCEFKEDCWSQETDVVPSSEMPLEVPEIVI